MAKMTKNTRRVVFESALNKIYGERFEKEENAFEARMEAVVEHQTRRIAKENGVDYEALITIYKPYTQKNHYLRFMRKDGTYLRDGLLESFYNEHEPVLTYEGANLTVLQQYKDFDTRSYRAKHEFPYPDDNEYCSESECEEIIAAFKCYGDFMNEVIASACAIRDVITSASTTAQLAETSPELGELIPALPGSKHCTALVSIETVEKVKALFCKGKE